MGDLDGLGYRGATVAMTGASSGMGAAAARILHDLGARLHLADVKPPSTPHERFYPTDLSRPDEVRATAAALGDIGPIDHVFACAGVPHVLGPVTCMLINYVGTRQFVEAVLPAMKPGGSIGVISSDAGMGWQTNLAANLELLAISDPDEARAWCEARPAAIRDGYSVSKEMLIVWAKHRGVAIAETHGVRINCIAPCPTATPFMDVTLPVLGEDYMQRFPYPLLRRMATPEEQAWPLVLLNSRLNSVVTGALLYTDQGYAGGVSTGALQVPRPPAPGEPRGAPQTA
jgi:NAD(P)-dependent dehydrogenase (short-subunit alcohol dehydrogenase family)